MTKKKGPGAELVCAAFNRLFEEKWPKNSNHQTRTTANVFDVNVYCDNRFMDYELINPDAIIADDKVKDHQGGYYLIEGTKSLYSLDYCIRSNQKEYTNDILLQHQVAFAKLRLYYIGQLFELFGFKNEAGKFYYKIDLI